jgi:hypothetical protein
MKIKTETILPIYGARIQLIVTDDILSERRAQEHLFGPIEGTCYDALCSYSGGHNFALFFEPNALTHRIIAHEIFHLTHRILEWVGVPFKSDNHEAFTAVTGELHNWFFGVIHIDQIKPDTLFSRNT